MGCTERVVFAFGAFREAGKSIALAQGMHSPAPAGDDLVRIALMPDIPDKPVMRRIEDIVNSRCELHHAKACAEVATGNRHAVDRFRAQFIGELPQFAFV